jgi:hypothetical protein
MSRAVNPWSGKLKPNYAGMRNDPLKEAEAERDAGISEGWASVLPMLGSIGGTAGGALLGAAAGNPMAGAEMGGKMGGAIGQAGGSMMNNQAKRRLDPFRKRSMQQEAMWAALEGLR